MAPVSKLLISVNLPTTGTRGWVQGMRRLDPGSKESGSRVIWVVVVGSIIVFGGIFGRMAAGTFGMMTGIFGGMMVDVSESQLFCSSIIVGESAIVVGH